MGSWDSYTQKVTPEDNDTLMIKDSAAGANKRTPFSGVWNWIVNKMTNAVISNLETTNKMIIPAINELNSNMNKIRNYTIITYTSTDANEYVKAGEIAYDAGANLILVHAIYDYGKPYGLMLKSKSGSILVKTEYSDFNNYGSPSILYYFYTETPNSYEVWCKRTDAIGGNSSIAYSVVKLSGI